MIRKCVACKKELSFPLKECDESGLAWHSTCFCCCVCSAMLNERDFNMRGKNKLYCNSHVIFQEGHQPVLKCYGMFRTYRIVF